MKIVKLELTRPVAVTFLALALTSGSAVAAKLKGENWCRVEPSWSSSVRQKLDLQALLGRYMQAPHVSVRKGGLAKAAVTERTATIAGLDATLAKRAPAKVIEVASCSGDRASILCPGYQLSGFEY